MCVHAWCVVGCVYVITLGMPLCRFCEKCLAAKAGKAAKAATGKVTRKTQARPEVSIRSLEKVETDLDGKIVYVDLQTTRKDSPSETKTLLSLLNHLNEIKPSDTTLGRMAPQGRKNRLFVAIVDEKVHTLLRAWVLCAIRRVSELDQGARITSRLSYPRARWTIRGAQKDGSVSENRPTIPPH